MSTQGRRRAPQSDPAPMAARVQAGHNLALGLRAAYLWMHRRANAVFSRFGLTADQFVLLTALAGGRRGDAEGTGASHALRSEHDQRDARQTGAAGFPQA